jgi:hypothetical protein
MNIKELVVKNKKIFALAIVILAIPSYFVYDYTQHNPRFCTTCHLMDEAYDTWDASAMHNLNCHKCHETDMLESLDHVREVLFEKPEEVTKLTEIDNKVCENCHASDDPKWLQVVNTAGHQEHFFGKDMPPDCIDCHGIQLHVFEPPEETCMNCHSDEALQPTEDMHIHCVACHVFTVADKELVPERSQCLTCHEASKTMGVSFPTGAHNDTACINCHNPHEEEEHKECSACHDVSKKGLHMEMAHTDCVVCHTPHSSVPMRDNCLMCHLDKIDHFAPAECKTCHPGS